MEKKLLMALMMSFMMTIALISCGGDSDDDDDNDTPQEETTGTTGTTGSTGTTGTTGTTGSTGTSGSSGTTGTTGGSTACLTNNQRENIRTFLNRASDLRVYTGTGTEFIREDGIGFFNRIEGTFDFQQTGENTWVVNSALCTVAAEPACEDAQTTLRIQNGCLTVNGTRARVTNSSDSSLSYRYLANGTVNESASLSSGLLRVRQSVRRDGRTVYELNFLETAP